MIRKPLPAPVDPLARWNLLGLAALSEPLPPIPWVCESLGLAPGAVALVAGYGYSGKTMALQSLALSVASGKSCWGLWRVRQGRVVHLDYEQGRRLTQERYQRLARGMGLELTELPKDSLQVAVMPHAYLDNQQSIDELAKIVEGATLVIVDSLRAAIPSADENSSDVRTYLDVLSRVSERTGACIVVIHHARKPSIQNAGTATHAIRGSGALFDACQSVYVLAGEKGQPTVVHHEKDRVRGTTLEDFGLSREDVAGPNGEANWGLRVVHLEAEQMAEAASSRQDMREERALIEAASRIITVVGADGFSGSRASIRSIVRVKGQTFDAAFARLTSGGFLARHGSVRDPFWTIELGHPNLQNNSPSNRPLSNLPTSEGGSSIHPPPSSPFRGRVDDSCSEVDHPPSDGPTLEERDNLFGNGISK